jgi:hypothetical protein
VVVAIGCGRVGFDPRSADAVTDPLAQLSDPFDGTSLDPSWLVLNPTDSSFALGGGELTITPTTIHYWYNADEGILIYKPVTGDFMITSEVHVDSTTMPGTPPAAPSWCMAAVLARDPSSPPENHVWVGIGADSGAWLLEAKTTVTSSTVVTSMAWTAGAQIRICRIGSSFQMLAGDPAGAWTFSIPYERPDLPNTVDVGVFTSCYQAPTELTSAFLQGTFATPVDATSCTSTM